ncbi:MAG TPA: CGNR zinc finger domain-containing protein [Terrimesophilobacter sp.]|nr:CGNR zinc finger domain-containing protein [Terrimesophilobacter sp.]
MPSTPIPHFDPGALSLEFAYAGSLGGIPDGVPEQWHTPSDLAAWLAERFAGFDGEATERELVDAILLRDAIARLAVDFAGGREMGADDVDTINLYAATPDIPPVLVGGRRQAGRTSVRTGQSLSAIARDAVRLFNEGNRGKVRQCAADDCDLVFFDESRSGNRRWCSMQRCGNREKVRSFRERASVGG